MKIAAALAGLCAVLVCSAASASTVQRTRVVGIVDEAVVFDRTVAAAFDTDAALNVLMAAQDAARGAGASELDIATGTTAEPGLVEVNAVTAHNVQDGDNTTDVTQSGSAQSGDAIDGQVVSVVGPGSVQQSNTTTNSSTHTGASSGSNTSD